MAPLDDSGFENGAMDGENNNGVGPNIDGESDEDIENNNFNDEQPAPAVDVLGPILGPLNLPLFYKIDQLGNLFDVTKIDFTFIPTRPGYDAAQ